MTLNCKKASLASGRDFYEHRYWDRVGGRYFPKTTGYSCPTDVYNAIVAKQQYTQEKRAASSEKREDRLLEEAEAAMDRLFPSIPADDRQAILDRAFEKGSGRIGRKAGFSMDEKILLASRAHIRYQHTDFEDVLERIKDGYRNMGERWDRHEVYDEAVAEVDGEVDEVVRLWRAPRAAAPLVAALPAQRTPQQAPLGAPSAVSPAPGAAKVEEWEAKDVKKLDPKDELKLEPAEVPSIEARVGKAEPSSEVAVKKEPAVPVVKVEKDDRME
ncbi:hypothetical protein DFJ74DRAFT_695308 [Hyaloraphidium curvatum]|nr:hypothetical protein DFJ74DRAFT_695308 [Hyaloraphidium curvatum]